MWLAILKQPVSIVPMCTSCLADHQCSMSGPKLNKIVSDNSSTLTFLQVNKRGVSHCQLYNKFEANLVWLYDVCLKNQTQKNPVTVGITKWKRLFKNNQGEIILRYCGSPCPLCVNKTDVVLLSSKTKLHYSRIYFCTRLHRDS